MKSFIVKSVLAVCITLFCLFYLDIMYERKSDNPLPEINKFYFVPEGVQVGNIGSSHGDADFSWNALSQERGLKCFNFSLASQPYEYDYALLNMHREDLAEGGVLFIPVSYFSFNTEAVTTADQEAIQVRYYRVLSPKFNPHYSLYKDIVAIRFPILSAGDKVFDLFKPPITFPSLSDNRDNMIFAAEESGGTALSINPAAAVSVASASGLLAQNAPPTPSPEEIYGAETVADFQAKGLARYQRHFDNKTDYFEEDKIQDLKNILELCQSRKVTPVLITTPFTYYYNQYVSQEFLDGFYSTIHAVAGEYGVSYYDYSHDERFAGNLAYFADADHLNNDGAVYFTNLLTEEIPELRDFLAAQ